MKIADICEHIEIINGETFYFIPYKNWDKVKNEPIIDGILLGNEGILKLVYDLLKFSNQHNDFAFAFTKVKVGDIKEWWIGYLLYKFKNTWQRVQIEDIICAKCHWKGQIANPTVPALFTTVKDKFVQLNKAWELETIRCPQCNSEFDRHAIWVG